MAGRLRAGAALPIVATLLALAGQPAGASTRDWLGGSATWDDVTTAYWSGGAVPVNGDTVNITSNTAANLGLGYTATGLTGSGLAQLTIGNSGGGTNTLSLDGVDLLSAQKMTLNAGGAINQTGGTLTNSLDDGNFNFINGGTYTMNGGEWRQGGGGIGVRGTVNQINGTVSTLQPVGAVTLVNGSWTISGGILSAAGFASDLVIGLQWDASPPTGATPTLNVNGGTVDVGRVFRVGGGLNNATSVVNQAAGTINIGAYIMILSNGTYNLAGGTLNGFILTMAAGTTFNNTGGIHNDAGGSMITATYNFSGGSWTSFVVTVGAGGIVNWTGGTLRAADNPAINALKLIGSGASWNMKGTALSVNRFGGGGAQSLFITNSTTVQGYGSVADSRKGASSPGTLDNSGRVIANGYGVDRTLDLSQWNSDKVANTTDNMTSNGWFAVDKGELLLPALPVPAGASTTNWGEPAADTAIDLVNSARIAFTGATAGSLTGALYAVDCAAVPSGLAKPVAVWSFAGVPCASAVLTFRYDSVAAAGLAIFGNDLRVWRYNGARWMDITDTRDGSAKTITALPVGSLASTTFFAVGGVRAGTVIQIR